MERHTLKERLVELLQAALDAAGEAHEIRATASSPLVGGDAVLSSITLVSYILDVETWVADEHGVEITLVNEDALSRRSSPFRTVETLADYVLELAGVPAVASAEPARRVAQA